MGVKPDDLEVPRLSDIALLWDEDEGTWAVAYRKDFTKFKTKVFVENVLFNDTDETYTSDSFECAGYDNFLLLINLIVASTPTDIVIAVELSDDDVNWFKYMRGPFGDLRYEDTAGNKKECIDGSVRSKFFRIKLTSSGCTATKTFLMTVKAIFTG